MSTRCMVTPTTIMKDAKNALVYRFIIGASYCLIAVIIFRSLVHGFNCLKYDINEGSNLTSIFHLNVKGRTPYPAIKLDGEITIIPGTNGVY